MATYAQNSILQYPTEILPQYNFQVLSQALQYKQQASDANALKNQELINQFSSIDLVKDVDKEYLANRLQTVVSSLNSLQGADLSSQNVAGILQGHISSVVDDKVLNAAASTKNYRKLVSEIDHVKTKELDKYSPINEAFAMRGAQAWLANPNAGAGYQGGTYTPYVDKNKAMLAIVKDLKETKGDQVIEVPVVDAQGNRRIQKKTIKGMTSEEIQAYLPNIIPSDVKQQLVIDGWAQYQGEGGKAAAREVFDKYVQQNNSKLDNQIETARIGETATGISKKQRQLYANQKQALLQEKSNFNTQIAYVNTDDVASLGGFLETNRWLNNFSQIAGARESVEYDTDTAYYAQKDLELDYAREARAKKESDLGVIKTGLEIEKLRRELNPITTGDVSMSPIVGEIAQEIDALGDVKKAYTAEAQSVINIAESAYNQGTDDQKKLFDAAKTKAISEGYAISNANAVAFKKVYGQSNPEMYNQLITAQTKQFEYGKALQKSEEGALLEQFQNRDNGYYEGLVALKNSGYADVETFLKNNNITAEALANPNTDVKIRKRAADLLSKYSSSTPSQTSSTILPIPTGIPGSFITLNQQNITDADLEKYPGLRRSSSAPIRANTQTGIYWVNDPYKRGEARQKEILAQSGYAGFISNNAANLQNEADRKIIKNSLPQGTGAFEFDEKSPMSVLKNADGSLKILQTKETTKDGQITPQTREANVAVGSDLYNYLTNKISPTAQRQVNLVNGVPTIKSYVSYLNDNESDTVRENSDFILNKGASPLNISGANPVNYLTANNTKQVYRQGLSKEIPVQKLDRLVDLMQDNGDKIEVKVDVEKGQYRISTFLRGVNPILLSKDSGGTSTEQVNLYTKQYPQITAGEAVYKYLKNNPEQVDTLINVLEE